MAILCKQPVENLFVALQQTGWLPGWTDLGQEVTVTLEDGVITFESDQEAPDGPTGEGGVLTGGTL